MISVAMFTYSTRPRGSVVHAAALSEALQRLGCEVTLHTLSKEGEGFYREIGCRLELWRAARAPEDPDALIAQRIQEVASHVRCMSRSYDIYHAQDCLTASGLLESGIVSGPARAPRSRNQHPRSLLARTVHHVEAYSNAYLRGCQARSIRQADLLLSASQATRLDVIRQFGLESTVVKNGVHMSRFALPKGVRALTARLRELGTPLPARFVLSVGGVEPRKNSIQALAAFAEVAALQTDLCWLIAGGASIWEHADYRARFVTELSKLPASLASRVQLLGPVSEAELDELYSASSLLLHPAQQEGFGLCVLEALASGCPVIVPRGAPFDEYLDENTAALVDPHSIASIAAAVHRVLNRSASKRASCRAAGQLTARRHDWQSVARVHVAAYEAATRLTPSCTGVLHA